MRKWLPKWLEGSPPRPPSQTFVANFFAARLPCPRPLSRTPSTYEHQSSWSRQYIQKRSYTSDGGALTNRNALGAWVSVRRVSPVNPNRIFPVGACSPVLSRIQRRNASGKASDINEKKPMQDNVINRQPDSKHPDRGSEPSKTSPGADGDAESIASSVSKYLHLPKMPHRPTKEELLAAANGFWERVRVRFKWMSIRSMRPWNADEWGAFVSWFMLGHIVWILVGTTTFFSLLIFSINTVFAQGKTAW